MITEVLDKHSGAILFKKDKESLNLEKVMREIIELRESVSQFKSEIGELKKKNTQLEKLIKKSTESRTKDSE